MSAIGLRCGAVLILLTCLVSGAQAQNAQCQTGSFESWLGGVEREAVSKGIAPQAVQTALAGVTYDAGVVSRDRRQGVFRQSFEQFSGRMIPPRLARGASQMQRNAATFARIEQQFGVPASVITAIWGLETDFGADVGNFPTIRSVASLAYDCRRSEMFRAELFDAIRIVQRGDLGPAQMHGAWAGEIGQTQFMPSSYIKFAIDYDGNGHRDLIRSVPDVLGSTANFLKSYGWKRGQPWGPGSENFAVIQVWNKSDVYSRTIAAFAEQLETRQ